MYVTLVVTIARTLHTYTNTIKILCQAFNVDFSSCSFKCEKKLIEEAHGLKRQGKNLVIIIDEAHWMDICPFPNSNHTARGILISLR